MSQNVPLPPPGGGAWGIASIANYGVKFLGIDGASLRIGDLGARNNAARRLGAEIGRTTSSCGYLELAKHSAYIVSASTGPHAGRLNVERWARSVNTVLRKPLTELIPNI